MGGSTMSQRGQRVSFNDKGRSKSEELRKRKGPTLNAQRPTPNRKQKRPTPNVLAAVGKTIQESSRRLAAVANRPAACAPQSAQSGRGQRSRLQFFLPLD